MKSTSERLLIEQEYYRLADAARLLGTSEDHLLSLGAMDKIALSAPVMHRTTYCWGKHRSQILCRPDLQYLALTFGPSDRVLLYSWDVAEIEAAGAVHVSQFIYDSDEMPNYKGETFCLESSDLDALRRLAGIGRQHLFLRASEMRKLMLSEAFPSASFMETSFGIGERATLQRQMAAIALLLAEKSGKYRKGEKPNASQIADAIGELVDALPDANRRGLSSANIRNTISEGLRLLTE